jgi:hypothetical protein
MANLWTRTVSLLLFTIALIGGYYAWQSGKERAGLLSQIAPIEKRIGSFPIVDPTLVHVQAMETQQPLEFAWRIYLPANFKMTLLQTFNQNGSSSWGGSNTQPSEFIARVVLREHNGSIECFTRFNNSSGVSSMQSPIHVIAIREHWEHLKIEQLGKPTLASIQPDGESTLLRISLPSELFDSLKGKHKDSSNPSMTEDLLQIRIVKQAP